MHAFLCKIVKRKSYNNKQSFSLQVIKTVVELTAFHGGWFEFRLCPLSYKDQKVKQSCFDENVLYSASGAGTRYVSTDASLID